MKCCIMQHFILVFTVYQSTCSGVTGLQKDSQYGPYKILVLITSVSSEGSDKPAHLCSLTSLCFLQKY